MATVLFFGPLSDVLETESVYIELNEKLQTVNDMLQELSEREAHWSRYLKPENLQITINRQFADANSSICNDDEIALISLPDRV